MGRERPNEFDKDLKLQVKRESRYRCTICGSRWHLEIHHKVPISHGGTDHKRNALCACNACHRVLDDLALKENKYYPEVLMTPGREYIINESMQYRDYRKKKQAAIHNRRFSVYS